MLRHQVELFNDLWERDVGRVTLESVIRARMYNEIKEKQEERGGRGEGEEDRRGRGEGQRKGGEERERQGEEREKRERQGREEGG